MKKNELLYTSRSRGELHSFYKLKLFYADFMRHVFKDSVAFCNLAANYFFLRARMRRPILENIRISTRVFENCEILSDR